MKERKVVGTLISRVSWMVSATLKRETGGGRKKSLFRKGTRLRGGKTIWGIHTRDRKKKKNWNARHKLLLVFDLEKDEKKGPRNSK